MDADRFSAFLAELVATAERDPDVIGLVGFGSTADRRHVDEWSDHDFAWLVAPGTATTSVGSPIPDASPCRWSRVTAASR